MVTSVRVASASAQSVGLVRRTSPSSSQVHSWCHNNKQLRAHTFLGSSAVPVDLRPCLLGRPLAHCRRTVRAPALLYGYRRESHDESREVARESQIDRLWEVVGSWARMNAPIAILHLGQHEWAVGVARTVGHEPEVTA